jgi:hypothetical protein
MISGCLPRSAGRPAHRSAAQDVGVDVSDGLAGLWAGIEDHAVATVRDALADSDLVGMRDNVGEQIAASGREFGQVRVVVARDHQDVDGSLRINVTESDRSGIARYDRRRYFSGRNTAEQALWHLEILTCTRPAGPLTYMVALRTHGAPPPRCNGPASFWLSVAQG